MYITDINGREIIYYDDRLEFDTLTILYKDMKNITQSFDGCPVFRFEYQGRDLKIPCKEDDYKIVVEYFRMAADQAQKSDPLEFLADDKKTESRSYSNYDRYGAYEDYGRYNSYGSQQRSEGSKTINKHLYVWLCSFMFGIWGIDRFIRGQIGLGILKIFTAGCFGIMYLYDWIQGIIKAYGGAYNDTEDLYFNADGSYTR